MTARVAWEVKGKLRFDFTGSWERCWSILHLLNNIPGPGIVYIQVVSDASHS